MYLGFLAHIMPSTQKKKLPHPKSRLEVSVVRIINLSSSKASAASFGFAKLKLTKKTNLTSKLFYAKLF